MATKSQLENHVRRLNLKIKCLEKDNAETPRDFIAERRAELSERFERDHYRVDNWLSGQWRIIRKPCRCGRNHYAIQSSSGLGEMEHCPLTWWGKLMLFSADRDKVRDLLDRMVRPIYIIERSSDGQRE
jgi:hypothetical protein